MYFNIDVNSGKPIYLQLKEQIKKAVASGQLEDGEKLPPVRELALELKINPNTVARAYRELKNEGFINTARGKGPYVSQPKRELNPASEKILEEKIKQVMVEAYQQGINKARIKEKFLDLLAQWEERFIEEGKDD